MTSAPSYDTLLANARGLVPRIAARAAETERLRRLPDATVKDIGSAGLWAAYRPARYRGAEIPLRGLIELGAILGSGCGSTSWVYNNLVVHNWMAGYWPAAAQDEIWADAPDTLIGSGLVMSAGRARAIDGGFRLSGRWPFSSGIDIAPWVLLGGFAEANEPRFYLVPRAEMTIIDTWQVMGLSGTGSKDVLVEDVFVPAHRSLPAAAARGGPHPGSAVNPGPLFRQPWYPILSFVTAGTSLGIAQGAVRDFAAAMRDRVATYSGRALADLPTLQLRIAEAATHVDAAEAVLLKDCAEADALAEAGELPETKQRARWRRDAAYAAHLAARAVDLVFAGAGGGAIHAEHPLQRALRDIHAANGHIGVNWDLNGALFGQAALGLAPEFPLL